MCMCICRCSTDDTAQYTVVASNIYGQASSQAAILVKSKCFYPAVLGLCIQSYQTMLISRSECIQSRFVCSCVFVCFLDIVHSIGNGVLEITCFHLSLTEAL